LVVVMLLHVCDVCVGDHVGVVVVCSVHVVGG